MSFEPRQPKPDQEPDRYLSYASNQPVSRASAPTIQAYTNQLGAEGWQLFHCHYVPRSIKSTLLRLIFKRPVEEQQTAIGWTAPALETLPTLLPIFQRWHWQAIYLFRKGAMRFIQHRRPDQKPATLIDSKRRLTQYEDA